MKTVLEPQVEEVLFPRPAQAGGLRRVARDWFDCALDLVYPPHCISCAAPLPGGVNKALCRDCARRIYWIGPDRCRRCGDGIGRGSGVWEDCPSCRTFPPAFVHSACSVARYGDGPVRDMILAMKFGAKLHLIPLFGELLAMRIQATQLAVPNMIVVPAPLTRASFGRRGFNQAQEIAAVVARRLKLPLETRLLQKIRNTPPQATLNQEMRRTNLKGAFACRAKVAARYKDKPVLLIDDVITTGSTVSECAHTLVGAGIGEVRAASVARG